MINKKLKRTFTLVEMLIVVVIIGILAAALIPRLVGAQERARDTARKGNLNNIVTALTNYYNDIGIYTGAAGTDDVTDIRGDLVPKYLETIPSDPQAQRITTNVLRNGATGLPGTAGQYGYAPMYKNGNASAGMIVVANTEGDGQNANWVYQTNANAALTTSAAARCTGICSSNGRLSAGSIVVTGTTAQFTESTDLQVALCSTGVALAKTVANNLNTCQGHDDNSIYYVIVK